MADRLPLPGTGEFVLAGASVRGPDSNDAARRWQETVAPISDVRVSLHHPREGGRVDLSGIPGHLKGAERQAEGCEMSDLSPEVYAMSVAQEIEFGEPA